MLETPVTVQIPEHLSGQRLDVVLAALYPDYSRNRLKQWILQGQILLDGQLARPRDKVYVNQELQLDIQPVEDETCEAEDIPLNIIYEDEALLIINKPTNMVVHPAAGNYHGTLQNALLFHEKKLATVPRAGIVHRLDKNTTGLMVIARTLTAHKTLVEQIQAHEIHREYQAVIHGVMTGGGTVDEPIGRHPQNRVRMTVRENGRPSVTHYRVLQRYRVHSHIHIQLETGRTHQIRVHMQHIKHPVVGDQVYAGRLRLPPKADDEFIQCLRDFKRQALHAWKLSFNHPLTNEPVSWQAPLPKDIQSLLAAIQKDFEQHAG